MDSIDPMITINTVRLYESGGGHLACLAFYVDEGYEENLGGWSYPLNADLSADVAEAMGHYYQPYAPDNTLSIAACREIETDWQYIAEWQDFGGSQGIRLDLAEEHKIFSAGREALGLPTEGSY